MWAVLGVARAAPDLQEALEYARVIALAVVPFAFLAGLLRSRVAAAAAVSELVARLGAGRREARCATRSADALGDPTLRAGVLASRARRVGRRRGRLASRCPPRTAITRARGSKSTARRWPCSSTHAALGDERELVQAVGGAAALALENERLDARLRASVQELRASRARLVESTDAARRRIERDLHDGAQQQLVTLAIALRRARSHAGA